MKQRAAALRKRRFREMIMLPENAAITIMDVLNYHQKSGHFKVPKRNFSAISLRLNTTGKYLFNGKSVSFKPPSICFIPEGLAYERFSYEDDVLVFHFNMLNCTAEDIKVFKISDPEKYRRLFLKALHQRLGGGPSAQYLEIATLYEIFGELAADANSRNAGKNSMAEAAEYMRQNFFHPELTVESLTRRANMSPAQFRRKFRQLYQISPKQYLDSLRFEYAKSLLETGYFTHEEIASRCGFSDAGYFRTAFKKKTGKCIREYLRDPM